MENDAVAQIQQRLAELPADVRDAIQAADFNEKVQAVGAKNQLHVDQIGELADEVMLAMLGFSPLEQLAARLVVALALPTEAAAKVAQDVNTDILGSIRESMKKFQAARAQVAPQTPAAAAPAAPTAPVAAPTIPNKPPLAPALAQANVVLTQPTVSIAPKPADNPIYKSDPYREPI